MFCSNCGTENSQAASFCSKCGTRLSTVEGSHRLEKTSRSTMRIVGSVISIVGAVIAICPLAGDVILGEVTTGYGANQEIIEQGQNLSTMTFFRLGIILLVILLGAVALSVKKPSKSLSIGLVITLSVALFLPQIMKVTASVGGLIGIFVLPISLIGAILLVIDSFKKKS